MNHHESLARHALALARENGEYHSSSVDDLEWDWDVEYEDGDWYVGSLPRHLSHSGGSPEEDEPVFVAQFRTVGVKWHQVVAARLNPPGKAHPAEYEAVEHEIGVTALLYPHRNDGLGDSVLYIDALT